MATNSKSNETRPAVDQERAQASIQRLMSIYSEISSVADEVSLVRCPYKDAASRCTASFDCRNQHFRPDHPGERAICTGSDKLDYRKAWQL